MDGYIKIKRSTLEKNIKHARKVLENMKDRNDFLSCIKIKNRIFELENILIGVYG